MSRFKSLILSLLLSPLLLGATKDPFMGNRMKTKALDRNALTDQINSLLPGVDSLARRTRLLDDKRRKEIAKSIKSDFYLDKVGNALAALRYNEKLLVAQAELKLALTQPQAENFEKKIKKLKEREEDLKSDVRDQVRYIVKGSSEEEVLAFQNWLMVNEGLLAKEQEPPTPTPTLEPTPEPSPTPAPAAKAKVKATKKKPVKD